MILNLWNEKRDMYLVQDLPEEVKEAIVTNLQILEENYGSERSNENLGGYAINDDIEKLKYIPQELK
ncbi:hypothetical protein [Romboutsia lituseburensis]|uniref:hypothetical protein n=1 Tax=Romboutsia lituseburensis TaxID=1537 RepID=UPI00215B055C|nr:hypothetical protein [Romboutsia lituseburensis]MCR8745865.1 hypothetical protein [Romboutsia lituseburensis]